MPAVNQHRVGSHSASVALPALTGRHPVRGESGARLDFHGMQLARVFKHQVHFHTMVIAPEVNVGWQSLIEAMLECLAHHPRFENSATQGMGGQRLRTVNAQQMAQQAGIQKIQLGHLDQTFAKVLVVRLQQVNHITGFKHRHPTARCGVTDAAIRRQRRQVEQLPGTRCTHQHEALKQGKLGNLQNLAHVAFNVSTGVGAQPLGRLL